MLILYTQPRCHFCEIMKRMLSKMDEAEGFQTIDITKDAEAKNFMRKKGHRTVPMLYWRVPGHDVWINKDIDTRKLTGENLGKRIIKNFLIKLEFNLLFLIRVKHVLISPFIFD